MNLKVAHINKQFNDSDVLKDVSLEIQKGEILSLTGESGCGKTTLLRIIAGLENTDSGKIFLNDQDITHWKPEKRKFGFVFQNLSLFPHLSVKQNIFYAVKKKNRKKEEKIKNLLEITGLGGLEGRMPHQLSGGQQQRVALARALAINPYLLMLDEPFSSIDELLKTKIREELFDLLRMLKITTILVSHQPTDAFLISDKLVVMKNGVIQQQGTPSDIYYNPASLYVSSLFGSSVIIKGKSSSPSLIETAFGDFGISNNHSKFLKLFIRPENIQISTSNDFNISGIIVKKIFNGPHDILKIGNKLTNEIITLETERCVHDVGDELFLKISENKIQLLGGAE